MDILALTFSPVFQQSYRITLRDASLENVEMERVIEKQLEEDPAFSPDVSVGQKSTDFSGSCKRW